MPLHQNDSQHNSSSALWLRLSEIQSRIQRLKRHVQVMESQMEDIALQAQQTQHHLYQTLHAFWKNQHLEPVYKGKELTLDLQTRSGRNLLLLFTTLLGARVRHDVAERTFFQLLRAGLLDSARLLQAASKDRRTVLEILQHDYRAVTNKAEKATALFANQAYIHSKWHGDIHHIYEQHKHNAAAFIYALQQFSHVHRRAMWLVREMRAHGLWNEGDVRAAAFYDTYTRTLLKRLHLLGEDTSVEAQERVVQRAFNGDVVTVYLHGKHMCDHNDVKVCSKMCPVKSYCSFWRQQSERAGVHA